jgi:hypothetical protein
VYKKITGNSFTQAQPAGTTTWIYKAAGSGSVGVYAYNNEWVISNTQYGASYCYPDQGYVSSAVNVAFEAATGTRVNVQPGAGAGGTCVSNDRHHIKVRSQTSMEQSIAIAPSTASEFASPPSGATTTTAGTNDTSTLTDTELDAALDAIGARDSTNRTTSDPAAEAAVDAINTYIEPSYNPDAPILMPQPQLNETYTAYLTRLQTLGYVGTATTVMESTALEGYGPQATTRVTVPAQTTTTTPTRTLNPADWPTGSDAPQLAKDHPITLRYNPSTATPVPEAGGGPGVGGTSPPAVDFSPITELDGACSFPFGFICYAKDITEWFDVTEDAPRFTFDIPTVTVLGETYGDIYGEWSVDLNVMDEYMYVMRLLMSVAMWVGAVYWLATRLLGFNAGGDPGEAVDEAMDY